MRKRSRKKKPRDVNVLAAIIVEEATKATEGRQRKQKNPAAVALGRLGGRKGGLARADKLTAARRSEIAKKAASVRWHKT